MTDPAHAPDAPEGSGIPGVLVLAPDTATERSIPIYDYLLVGRECAGVDNTRRLLIEDDTVSRIHLEVRLDIENDQAWLTDRSTNGTRLNGQRIDRHVPVQIAPGDRVRLGSAEVQFRSRRFSTIPADNTFETVREITVSDMVMVVGDIICFSTISEYTDDRVLLENIDRLYAHLRGLLTSHGGSLRNFVGDAIFATWETKDAQHAPDATAAAVAFALAATESMPEIAPSLTLRDPAGGPLRMGWGVASGPAAVSSLTGTLISVLSDTTNVAFRLSGIAGRDGVPSVLVTGAVRQATAARFAYSPPSNFVVKGRKRPVEVSGARWL